MRGESERERGGAAAVSASESGGPMERCVARLRSQKLGRVPPPPAAGETREEDDD